MHASRLLNKLKAKYERRNLLALLGMAFTDMVCWFFVRLVSIAEPNSPSSPINKVLLVNPAHIGDVVISTAAIRQLKDANRNISIGVVVGSWAKAALEKHPGVDQIFIVDHWRLNRSNLSTTRKIWRYIKTWQMTRRALVRQGYDAGVLLNGFSPNFASLLWFARIRIRIGYVSAGMTPLLNLVLPKPLSCDSEQRIQLRLLESMGFYGSAASWLEVPKSVNFRTQVTSPYVVLHPGTGNPAKAWMIERWVEVGGYFQGLGFEVVVTGQGKEEQRVATEICSKIKAVNLVDALSWDNWLLLLANANLIIGVDSVVGHVSATLRKPFIGIYSGIGVVNRWTPSGELVKVLTKVMPCSPCHTRPCAERPCITTVTAHDVIVAASVLSRKQSANNL